MAATATTTIAADGRAVDRLAAPGITRRPALAVFVVLLASYAYFLPAHQNANAVSRMALAVALVERGTTVIDGFHEQTIDRAFRDGHYYSDKAPGQAFTAQPAVALVSLVAELTGLPDGYLEGGELTLTYSLAIYLATITTSGLATAAAAAALVLVALRLGATAPGALLAALGFGLASPGFGWATNFFGHALAGALLFLAFAVAHRLSTRTGTDSGRDAIGGVAVGGLLGWAVVVEFTSAPAAGLIGLWALATVRGRWPPARIIRAALPALIGAVLVAIPLFVYNAASFGSPLATGYAHLDAGWEGMDEGIFGLTYPKLDALYGITLSPYRGLLVFCPLAALAPLAIYRLARTGPEGRGVARLSAAVALYYLLFNASYHYWDGGYSAGPRHLTPMLPFLFLPFAWLWTPRPGATMQTTVLVLAALSFGVTVATVAVTGMIVPTDYANPLGGYVLPRLLSGGGENIRTVFAVAGWRSASSLLPFALLLLAGGLALLRWAAATPRAGDG